MTIVIVGIFIIGFALIATESFTKINKAAIAIFAGILCWVLLLLYGRNDVANEYATEFYSFLLQTNSDSIRAFIAKGLFLKSIATACEIILYILATMGIVEVLNNNGCFDFINEWLRTRSSKRLLWGLAFVTYILSANLDNFTTIAMMLVIMHALVANSRQRMIYGSVIVLAANCGGALTVIGDMNSLILWVRGLITPTTYSFYMFVPTLLAWVVPTALLSRHLPEHLDSIPSQIVYRGDDTRLNRWQRLLMLIVGIGGLWFIPTFHRLTYFSPFVGALCVLSLLWVVDQLVNRKLINQDEMVMRRLPRALQFANIQTIFFFLGISLMVDAVHSTGILHDIASWCDVNIRNVYILGALMGLASAVLDNTALLLANASAFGVQDVVAVGQHEYLRAFYPDGLYWPIVSFSAALGGSLLTIGSAGGYMLSKMENVSMWWYLRFVTGRVLIGWLVGLIAFFVITMI